MNPNYQPPTTQDFENYLANLERQAKELFPSVIEDIKSFTSNSAAIIEHDNYLGLVNQIPLVTTTNSTQ